MIAWGVGMGLAFGDAPKPASPPRAKPKVIDLDFTDDDEEWTPAPGRMSASTSRGRWLYWTLGAGAAAAGGIGWYLFREEREPTVTRNERIFTDER